MSVIAHDGSLDDVRDLLIDNAIAQAREEGRLLGHEQAQGAATGALEIAVERLDKWREEAIGALAHTSVEIAIEVARQLVQRELSVGNIDVEAVVRETLATASAERKRCVVHLHPDDAAALEGVPFRAGTEIQGDVGVARGDVHVETALGLVVRELDGLLEAIAERLREEVS